MKLSTLMLVFLAFQTFVSGAIRADPPAAEPGEIALTKGLVVGPVGQYKRSAVFSDPFWHRLAAGTLEEPVEGGIVTGAGTDRERAWTGIEADEEGWFQGKALRGGWLYIPVRSDREEVMILEATGHSLVLVNGEPRGGDVYSYGWVQHPVRLTEGTNDLFFRVSRGKVRARLVAPARDIFFTKRDILLPDVIAGEPRPVWGAVRVINASAEELTGLRIRCRVGVGKEIITQLPVIGPMTSRKVGFLVKRAAPKAGIKEKLHLTLDREGEDWLENGDTLEAEISIRSGAERHKRTFISAIDGSVQYYSVTPGRIEEGEKAALFLSLHGASVKAENQAASYKPKSWGHVVAATNRRPYGFDWEDWGRLDALEVLDLAGKRFRTDPSRTYLTGHSMGGHGTWTVGALFPARFAAIAPSAGWYSFWSYAGKDRDEETSPIEELFARASSPSDTIALSRNFLHHGVYILHGDVDDYVPVAQARFMREHLAGFHADFAYYERPGAGHWWGGECVDWPPLFDFLKCHTIPGNREVKSVEFITPNPGISSRSRWLEIGAQQKPLRFSTVKITQDVKARTFAGTTENVARLSLDLAQLDPGDKVDVELDGQKIEAIPTPAGVERIHLARGEATGGEATGGEATSGEATSGDATGGAAAWAVTGEAGAELKGPRRYGTFKDTFRHRVIFLYGTKGTAAENAWSYAKARFDAETFWYRGNGSIDVVADRDFDPAAEPDRSVIVYGSFDTNSSFEALLAASPVQVRRKEVSIGGRTLSGDDLACLFVRPRPGSDVASVGVVAGTGLSGMKAADMNMYFISGSGYPDVLVYGTEMLEKHFDGVRVVGFFGNDWSVEKGEFAWRD